MAEPIVFETMTTRLTAEQIAELRRLLEAAEHNGHQSSCRCLSCRAQNAASSQLVYALDAALPALLSAAERLVELERRDWVVRVLDAWTDVPGQRRVFVPHPLRRGGEGSLWIMMGVPQIRGASFDSQDAVRLAAARSVFPELPESVRAEIGEEPA